MRRLQQLLEDILEDVTGNRETPHTSDVPNEFALLCRRAIDAVATDRQELIEILLGASTLVPDDSIIIGNELPQVFASTIEKFISKRIDTAVLSQKQRILHFIFPASSAIYTLGYAHLSDLGYGAHPDKLRGRKQAVVEGAESLSKFPGMISGEIRTQLMQFRRNAIQDGDITEDFYQNARLWADTLIHSPEYFERTNRMGFCPAHTHTKLFADIAFDGFSEMYFGVFERLSDGKDSIPDDVLARVKEEHRRKMPLKLIV